MISGAGLYAILSHGGPLLKVKHMIQLTGLPLIFSKHWPRKSMNHKGDHHQYCKEPDDDIQRIWGTTTKELENIFSKYEDDRGRLPIASMREACYDLNLYPSQTQVYEMVHCAVEYGSPCEADHITFGEFCILLTELQKHYEDNPQMPKPKSLVRSKSSISEKKRKKKVFLGGSCNPTEWRQDIAIPFFKRHDIAFYNPQVQKWSPELMEIETQAKQTAEVMFFVVDNETRAIASMIETAYLVAHGRQILVVIRDYEDGQIQVEGDTLTDLEVRDLYRGRLILTDLVERNSVPIFSDVNSALHCTEMILKNGRKVQELSISHGARPIKHGYLTVGEGLLELREAFNSVDNTNSRSLNLQDICLAYKCCTGNDLDQNWLSRKAEKLELTFEEFCCIVAEYQSKKPNIFHRAFLAIVDHFRDLIRSLTTPEHPLHNEDEGEIRDIYLGGSFGGTEWREIIAIPLIRKSGLSYCNPYVVDWEQKLIPIQVATREKCRVLLYVVTSQTRAISSMIEAGYYAGMGCQVVICIQKLQKDTVMAGEKLSEKAIRDYNRGRAYLTELASQEGVPLFDDIDEAVNCAINYCIGMQCKEN